MEMSSLTLEEYTHYYWLHESDWLGVNPLHSQDLLAYRNYIHFLLVSV